MGYIELEQLSTARSLILEEGRELSPTGLEMQAVNGVR
jgi:hypothetical protein